MRIEFLALPGNTFPEKAAHAQQILRKNPGSTLFIAPGRYHAGTPESIRFQQDLMAGKLGHSPALFQFGVPWQCLLSLENCHDITIEADGVELVVHGFMQSLNLSRCSRVTIHGLHITHDRHPFSSGVIISDTEEYTDIRFRDNRMLCNETPTVRTLVYQDERYCAATQSAESFQMLDAGVGRFNKLSSRRLKGAEIYVWHCFNYRPAVLLHECESITLDSLWIHSQPGHGVVAHRCGDLLLRNVKIVPAAGLRVSTNVDATHFASCHGRIRLLDCRMAGQGDDSVNVHTYYHRVLEHSGCTGRIVMDCRDGCSHSFLPDHPDPGDVAVISRARDLQVLCQAKVQAVAELPEHCYELILDTPFPETQEELLLHSVGQICPKLEIRNCIMREHHARGMLIKARNVLIENNFIYNTQLTAIEFAPEELYAEGTESENVVIRGNCIYDCGSHTDLDSREFHCTGAILFQISWKARAAVRHRNILIEDNLIHCPKARHAIMLRDVDGAEIRNNLISVRQKPVVIEPESCRNVTIAEVKDYELI